VFLLAGLIKKKNVDVVIRALAKVEDRSNIHLVVAQRICTGFLKKSSKELGVEDDVTFMALYLMIAPPLYAGRDCFVNACTAELQCIALMEAMATASPQLAQMRWHYPELIHPDENGYLFEPGNSDELAQCIVKMFSGLSKRKKWAKKPRNYQHHDIHVTLEKFEVYYRQAIPGYNGGGNLFMR